MPTTTDMQVRDRLKAVRDDLRGKRSERATLKRARDDARDAFANAQHDGKVTDWPEFQAAEQAVKTLGECDDHIADLSSAEQGILRMLGDEASQNGNGSNPALDLGHHSGHWDAHRLLVSSEETPYLRARNAGIFNSSAKFGTLMLGEIADRDHAASMITGGYRADLPAAPAGIVDTPTGKGLVQPDHRGFIQPQLRQPSLLQLFPAGATDSNTLDYTQVIAIPASAAPVAEGAVKPQEGITLQDATAPVRTIAGWIKMNRQAMDDAAGLTTLINTLLPYDVRRQIEWQIINGDGTGQNLTGILRVGGINNPAAVGGDNYADKVLRAMTQVILSMGEPNFAAMHPIDWQNLLLLRENTGGAGTGGYLYGGPATMAAAQIWGMAITPTTALPLGTALVGDSAGATVLFREGVNVKTSDSDQDDFIRNRVTVLAECRVAFPVWRPTHFAIAD